MNRRKGRKARLLLQPKRRARLDQIELQGLQKVGPQACGAQQVAHQNAASGAKLDQMDRVGSAHRLPRRHDPDADQFAEHLRDFRRGDEIPLRSKTRPRGVIAGRRIMQAIGHELGRGDRPLFGDQGLEARL